MTFQAPTPPYPLPDSPVLTGLVKQALEKFESGQMSVAGAIMASASAAWAIGHQEGEDLCIGCTHRPMTGLPDRVAAHPKCFVLALTILEQSLKTYVETWILLVKQGAVRYPQSEAEMRGVFQGMQNVLAAFKLLSEQAVKKGAT